MAEQKAASLYQQQKVIKPLIEDVIPVYLDGDRNVAAMDFVAYMRDNRMKPTWCLTNKWKATYKGKAICNISISTCNEMGYHRGHYEHPGAPPSWIINPYLTHMDMYKEQVMDEGLQDVVWNHIFRCVYSNETPSFGIGCNPNKPCAPGGNIMVLGKEIMYNCCNHLTIVFWNPDGATIKDIKRLLELEKKAREKEK